jgi:activating signal cointegrator 1
MVETTTHEMAALTLWQPWATLVAIGAKRIETRSWKPPAGLLALVDAGVKPWIAIHAAARTPPDDLHYALHEPAIRQALYVYGLASGYDPNHPERWLTYGAVVGAARLAGADSTDKIGPTLSATEWAMGNYETGRFCWRFEDAHALPEPMPCRGRQQVWRLTPMQTDMINALLRLAADTITSADAARGTR